MVELSSATALHLLTLKARNASPDTLRRYEFTQLLYRRWLVEYLEAPPILGQLTAANVQRFILWLQTEYPTCRRGGRGPKTPGASASNVAQRVADLKTWSRFLAEHEIGGLATDPLAKLRRPKAPKVETHRFTTLQVKLLADLCEQTREKHRNRAIVLLFAETGVRVTELCTLRLEHLEPATTRRMGRALVVGKGSKQRYVLFGVRCWLALGKYLELKRKRWGTQQPYVFLREDGQPLRRQAVEELIRELGARAGFPASLCHPHAFRHYFGTEYLRQHPGQLQQLAMLLGHSSLVQVTHYARLASTDVEGSWSSIVDDW